MHEKQISIPATVFVVLALVVGSMPIAVSQTIEAYSGAKLRGTSEARPIGGDPCRPQDCSDCITCCDLKLAEAYRLCRWVPEPGECYIQAEHQYEICEMQCLIDFPDC